MRTLGAGAAADLQIVAQISLGTRERAVLLRAGSQQLLLGVAPGNVRLLYALPALSALLAVPLSGASASAPPPASASAAGPTPPNFGELLRRSFGMKP